MSPPGHTSEDIFELSLVAFYSARALEIPVGSTPLLMDLDSFPRWPSPLVHTAERIPTCGGLLTAEAIFINAAFHPLAVECIFGVVFVVAAKLLAEHGVGRGGKGNCSRKPSQKAPWKKLFPALALHSIREQGLKTKHKSG